MDLCRQCNISAFQYAVLVGHNQAFSPRSNRLLVSWLQSPSAVILEPKKIKSVTVSIVSPYICHEVMEPDAMILVFLNVKFLWCEGFCGKSLGHDGALFL